MRIQGGFVGLLWFVETEFVIPTVLGTRELLNQEHDCIVKDSQHPQAVNTCRAEGTRVAEGAASDKRLPGTQDPWARAELCQRLLGGEPH